jgi:drug/metabolite transporter (DMT)-like permease
LALSKLLTRKLVLLGAKPAPLTAILLLFMTPVSLPLALLDWQTPSALQWPWLLLLGLLAALSHLSFAKAYQLAEVTFLAPFGFSKFIVGTLIGYLVFAEFPNSWSLWIGMLIIGFSLGLLPYKMPLYSEAKRFKSN